MTEPTSYVADTICRTVELGVTITGAAVDAQDRTRLWCQVLGPDALSAPVEKCAAVSRELPAHFWTGADTLAARVAGLLGNCVITPTGS